MKRLVLLALLSPALAVASDCEHSQPRPLELDLAGVRTVRIEVNANELRLGPVRGDKPGFSARACASDPALFHQLSLTQDRQGDVLVIRAEREGYSTGASIPQLQQLFLDEGAEFAFNLDGGGSTTLYFRGEVINMPSGGKERSVSDVIMFTAQ